MIREQSASISHAGRKADLLRDFLADFRAFAGQRAWAGAAWMMAAGALEVFGLAMLVPMANLVFGTSGGPWHAWADRLFHLVGAGTTFERLAVLSAVMMVLIFLRGIVGRHRTVVMLSLQIGYLDRLRMRIAERLATASWDRIVPLRHARVTHIMSGDVQRLGVATHFLLQAATSSIMLAAQCALAIVLSPWLAIIAIVFLMIGSTLVVPVLRRARELGSHVTDANLSLLNETTQFLGGLKLARSQDLQHRFLREFGGIVHALTARQIDYAREQATSQFGTTTIPALFGIGLILIGYGAFHIAPAVLVALVAVIAKMVGPAQMVTQALQQIAHAMPAYAKIRELDADLALHTPATVADTIMAVPDGPIVFERVTFLHPGSDEREARGVTNLSLVITPGEFLGISGPSGSGKSTFADLLAGLYPPQSGRILVGGTALDASVLTAWRHALGYVSQDVFLLHTSLRRNLLWACDGASDDEIHKALALIGADGLVKGLTEGLETVVGERGSLMSGGERQRLALARAILRKPKLLILDEATSAIDIPGERVVLNHLKALQPRPTIVLIAHRAESLALCDRVVSFPQGSSTGNAL